MKKSVCARCMHVCIWGISQMFDCLVGWRKIEGKMIKRAELGLVTKVLA